MIVVVLLAGLVVGGVAAYLVSRTRVNAAAEMASMMKSERDEVIAGREAARAESNGDRDAHNGELTVLRENSPQPRRSSRLRTRRSRASGGLTLSVSSNSGTPRAVSMSA